MPFWKTGAKMLKVIVNWLQIRKEMCVSTAYSEGLGGPGGRWTAFLGHTESQASFWKLFHGAKEEILQDSTMLLPGDTQTCEDQGQSVTQTHSALCERGS